MHSVEPAAARCHALHLCTLQVLRAGLRRGAGQGPPRAPALVLLEEGATHRAHCSKREARSHKVGGHADRSSQAADRDAHSEAPVPVRVGNHGGPKNHAQAPELDAVKAAHHRPSREARRPMTAGAHWAPRRRPRGRSKGRAGAAAPARRGGGSSARARAGAGGWGSGGSSGAISGCSARGRRQCHLHTQRPQRPRLELAAGLVCAGQ